MPKPRGVERLGDTEKMIHCTTLVTGMCAELAKDTAHSPHTFIKLYREAKDVVLTNTENLELSSKLLTVLARTYTLYFAILNVQKCSAEQDFPEASTYVIRCIEASCRIAELFVPLFSCSAVGDIYAAERNLALADNEALMHRSKGLRFLVLGRYKRIFAALPELELIYSCCELLQRSVDLCRSFDNINTAHFKEYTV